MAGRVIKNTFVPFAGGVRPLDRHESCSVSACHVAWEISKINFAATTARKATKAATMTTRQTKATTTHSHNSAMSTLAFGFAFATSSSLFFLFLCALLLSHYSLLACPLINAQRTRNSLFTLLVRGKYLKNVEKKWKAGNVERVGSIIRRRL